MSLINKMLQDLDARGTPKDGTLPGQVKPVAAAGFGTGRRAVVAAVGAAVAVLALGAVGWKMLQHGAAPAAPSTAPVVAPTVATGARSVPVATGPAYGADAPAGPWAPASATAAAAPGAPAGAARSAASATFVPGASGAAATVTGSPASSPAAQPAATRADAAASTPAPMPHAARTPQADPMAPPGAAAAAATPALPSHAAATQAARDADRSPARDDETVERPPTRSERRAERQRLAAERREERAAARRADRTNRADEAAPPVRAQDVAPMEPDSAEARAARRAMAQLLASRSADPKTRSAAMLAAARVAAHDEPAPKAKRVAQGRQESGAPRAEAEYRRALAYLQDGRMTDTIAALEAALRADPAHDAARQTLVGVLIEAGRTDEAMRQLQLGLTLDARQPAMAMLLARLQIERGASGIETLTRTLPYAGGDPDYRAFLAAALARQGRHREAAEQYVQAVRAAPGNGVWWMGLGLSLQAEKRGAEALEAFQKARATGALSPELQGFVERRIQQLGR